VLLSRLAPQSPQNLALGGLTLPQSGHGERIGAPHSIQKRLPSGTAARQLGHSMPHLIFRDRQPTTEPGGDGRATFRRFLGQGRIWTGRRKVSQWASQWIATCDTWGQPRPEPYPAVETAAGQPPVSSTARDRTRLPCARAAWVAPIRALTRTNGDPPFLKGRVQRGAAVASARISCSF
jgi:hypothetical protein